jgi:chromosome segregation ATPase
MDVGMDDELRKVLEDLRSDVLGALHTETAAIRSENAAAHEETRRHIAVAVEQLQKRFDLLAESDQNLQEQIHRLRTALEEKFDTRCDDLEELIRFSYKELDGRVTALERDRSPH